MSYRLVDTEIGNCGGDCPKIIVGSGTIQRDEHRIFAEFIRQSARTSRLAKILLLESPGGFVVGGFTLGIMVRKLKMSVMVGRHAGGTITRTSGLTSATCASACVLALAGGTKRWFVSGSRIGVHQVHTGPEVRDPLGTGPVNGKPNTEVANQAYHRYFGMMGIDRGLIAVIDRTPGSSIHWLSEAELARFRLAQNSARMR